MYPASLSFTTVLRTTRHQAFLQARARLLAKAAQARDGTSIHNPGFRAIERSHRSLRAQAVIDLANGPGAAHRPKQGDARGRRDHRCC